MNVLLIVGLSLPVLSVLVVWTYCTRLASRGTCLWSVFSIRTSWIVFVGPTRWIPRGFQAVVVSRSTVRVKRAWDERLPLPMVRHELCHCAQWHRHGWTFPLRYAWQFALALGRASRVPLEQEARRWERDETFDVSVRRVK
jgi:hypothetical protein